MNDVINKSMTDDRADFYRRIDPDNLYPLWEVVAEMITKEPQTEATPYLWRFEDVRPHVVESADLVSGDEAERRTLMLENPSMRGKRRITQEQFFVRAEGAR